MPRGFGFGAGRSRRNLFNPATLFTGGLKGGWYDPSDVATVFTDTAGTTQANVGDAVARINDKSGNSAHLLQATAAARPVLREDGGGRRYLDFDGVDDYMDTAGTTFGLTQPSTSIAAFQMDGPGGVTEHVFDGVDAAQRNALFIQGSAYPFLWAGSNSISFNGGFPLVAGVSYVATAQPNGAASKTWLNGVRGPSFNPGAQGITQLRAGCYLPGNSHLDGRVYGLFFRTGLLNDSERVSVENLLAIMSGATIELPDGIPYCVGHTVFHNNASGSSAVNITWPDDVEPNDVALYQGFIWDSTAANSLNVPTNFTQKDLGSISGSTTNAMMLAWKRCDGAESGNLSITTTAGHAGTDTFGGILSIWRGCVATGDPIEGLTAQTGSSANPQGAAVTTLGSNRRIVHLIGNGAQDSVTAAAGYGELYDFATNSGTAEGALHCLHKEKAAAGVEAAATHPLTGSRNWRAVSFALIPAA